MMQRLAEIYKHFLFVCYLIVQYAIVKKWQQHLRVSIIILNHAISFFFQFTIADEDDIYSSFIKGANIVGLNYVMLISGEFIDAAISIFSIALIRLVYVIIQTNQLQYSMIASSFIIILYTIRSMYQYHRAIRSQYLLSQVDSQWEKILNAIAFKHCYLIFSFQEDTLSFKLKSQAKSTLFFSESYNGMDFIKDASYKGQGLSEFLYQYIKKYKVERASIFNRTLVVTHLKKVIRMELSIFYGKEPMILLLFKDYLHEKKVNLAKYEERHRELIRLLSHILGRIKRFRLTNLNYQILRRKLLILQLYDSLKNNRFTQGEINLFKLAHQLNSLYDNLSVRSVVTGSCNINTIPNIFLLIVVLIGENTKSPSLHLKLINLPKTQISLEIIGYFDILTCCAIQKQLIDYEKLIFSEIKINQQRIHLIFNEQVFLPFSLSDLGSQSLRRI